MKLTSTVVNDEITKDISSMMDYEFNGESSFEVPKIEDLPESFSIGLIVGASGSGKSSLLKSFGEERYVEWDKTKAICSHFKSAQEAQEKLSSVGLNSIPSWVKPFSVLSTGEAFRANLAVRLENGCVIDEFTSVVDRNVAKSCSASISKYIRNNNLSNIVFASCHRDIVDWLQPDWVFDTDTKQLTVRGVDRQPRIHLEIVPTSYKEWDAFSQHHYLDHKINKSARCWLVLWGDIVVGFTSAIAFPNAHWKNGWREHRTVTLPDFQGLGIGVRVSDAIGCMFVEDDCRYFSKTSHPRMGGYRNSSTFWRGTSKNGKKRKDYKSSRNTKEDNHKMRHVDRVCYSHEYIGGQ